MERCKTCAHWKVERADHSFASPTDPDTYEPMQMSFAVRRCRHPELRFHERPLEADGFAVTDGSEFFAALYTGEDFGCVRHQTAAITSAT